MTMRIALLSALTGTLLYLGLSYLVTGLFWLLDRNPNARREK